MKATNYPTTGGLILAIMSEPRIDSRQLAFSLGIKHRNAVELISTHESALKQLGVLLFQTEKPRAGSVGGRPEQFVLLIEDQCYFLLTLSRNTAAAVQAKLALVGAFKEARQAAGAKTMYLPSYHRLHDSVQALGKIAHASGSKTPEAIFHQNINRLMNSALGIVSGERDTLTADQQAQLSVMQQVADAALVRALADSLDYHQSYQVVKRAVWAFAQAMHPVLRELAA